MKKVHIIAHTHWDYEWYFTRQQARVQFAYHLNEVLKALEDNKIDYYLLDGQMAIVDDYLETNPDKKVVIEKFVKEKRLFVGPWYTQIDELVTPGEAVVRNLQLGLKEANDLGGAMEVGYLPDSFGQSQDMPKIYNGFGIENAVFWRGMPKEKNARYFYWTSDDESKVLVTEIRNSYAAGADIIDTDNYVETLNKISTDTDLDDLVLPTGGDQRPVDFNLKERINYINKSQDKFHLIEDNYPTFFKEIKGNEFPTYSGEFFDAYLSKIHRGIYSSRADIKSLYNKLENLMINEIEPLMMMAKYQGIEPQKGMVSLIWKTISREEAHDSSGGCNSDPTNKDIKNRGLISLQMADALKAYLLRKLSSNIDNPNADIFFWNAQPNTVSQTVIAEVTTMDKNFGLEDLNGKSVDFEVLKQDRKDASNIKQTEEERDHVYYYVSKIAVKVTVPAFDWTALHIIKAPEMQNRIAENNSSTIENQIFRISFNNGQIDLFDKRNNKSYPAFISFEDGGDEGDSYDYSPAHNDWILNLNFKGADICSYQGSLLSTLVIKGKWSLPADLCSRKEQKKDKNIDYVLKLALRQDDSLIQYDFVVNNQVKDHRLRLILNTPINNQYSYADTAFGYSKRPVIDPHLNTWQKIGYHEEPTALHPMIHFVNAHDNNQSWTYLSNGQRAYQFIGNDFSKIAVTLFRCTGYQGRPQLVRRPGDASGLINKWVPTPDAQLQGEQHSLGGFLIENQFDPAEIQRQRHQLVSPLMYYQNQSVNEYTTELQHFRINSNQNVLSHINLFKLDSQYLVCSSVYLTDDNQGIVLRLYNPTKENILDAGKLQFNRDFSLVELNLNNQYLKSLETTNNNEYELGEFKPGQIKTYGLYPVAK